MRSLLTLAMRAVPDHNPRTNPQPDAAGAASGPQWLGTIADWPIRRRRAVEQPWSTADRGSWEQAACQTAASDIIRAISIC